MGPSKFTSSTDDPSAVGLHLRIITRLELAVERLQAVRASFTDSLSESTKGRMPIVMLSETELISLVRVCVRLSKLEDESGHLTIFIGASAGLE
jgi:hypothetical protein